MRASSAPFLAKARQSNNIFGLIHWRTQIINAGTPPMREVLGHKYLGGRPTIIWIAQKTPFPEILSNCCFFDQDTFLIYQVKTVITRLPNGQQINCVADNRPEKISAKSAKFLYKAAKVSPEFPFLSQNMQNWKPEPGRVFRSGFGFQKLPRFPGFPGFG